MMIEIKNGIVNLGRSIIGSILKSTWNCNKQDSVGEFKEIFNEAQHNVQIVAGELESTIFENPEVIDGIRKAINRERHPVNIEILCGPNPDNKTRTIWKLAREKGNQRLHITKLPERPNAHFVIVDGGKRIRVEEFHKANSPERLAYGKKNTLFLGSILQDDFDLLKYNASVSNSKKVARKTEPRVA